jgi:hypothetical protein
VPVSLAQRNVKNVTQLVFVTPVIEDSLSIWTRTPVLLVMVLMDGTWTLKITTASSVTAHVQLVLPRTSVLHVMVTQP